MPGRSFSAGNQYRYGFNGKENDKDISDGAQDYGMRVYDGRLGKFLSVDPLQTKFAFLSPFAFAANSPLRCTDIDGKEPQDYMAFWARYPDTYIGKWGQNVGDVYDKVSNNVWTVMSYPNQEKIYYWKPFDGNNGTFDYEHNGTANKDKHGNWTGAWQAFETRDAFQARKNLTDKSLYAVTVLPIVAVPGIIVSGFLMAEAGTSYLSSLAVKAYASWWRWAPAVGYWGRQIGSWLDETGTLGGANNASKFAQLELDEQIDVKTLIESGRKVDLIPRAAEKTADFLVDGIETELKTLKGVNGFNMNTTVTAIQKAFKQGKNVILNARGFDINIDEVNKIIDRVKNSYPSKELPGGVEIWTPSGQFKF